MNTTVQKTDGPSLMAARGRRGPRADGLGVAWLHGTLHVTAFRRQQPVTSWAAGAAVHTLDEFKTAFAIALEQTGYGGTEVFIILENDAFVHQLETVPSFSDKAARAYLRGRVERIEKEKETMLWVGQPAMAVRKERAWLLHLLSGGFYYQLNEILITHRLELTRVLPLIVPLQLELAALAPDMKAPVLLAAEAGAASAVMAGIPSGDVLFSRTTLASWRDEPARVAVEINRSLLYAKQQFGASVEKAWLLGAGAADAVAEVASRCGADKKIVARSAGPAEWLQLVVRLPHGHPVNLVASHLKTRRRRRWIRAGLIAACWMGLALTGIESWKTRETWQAERLALTALAAEEPALLEERQRLEVRNTKAAGDHALVTAIDATRLPPVPGRFFATLAGTLPREIRLTEFVTRVDDDDRWSVKIDGEIEADEETARMLMSSLRRQLARGPFRVRFLESARPTGRVSIAGATVREPFTLEGVLFED